ncbi:MFS transporter [Fluviispira vulneris]|uniref:MFS transporter n=1 Tax=Fluviispira vulneris TaxID=2763012 RepID=UPI0016455238|nr:MFS transporter [Fluviispira vulneris]
MNEINPFILQVIISNVPSVLTSGFFPILGSSFGAAIVNIGLFFFLLRIGNVIGSLISPKIANKYEPHKIGTVSEVLFAITTFLILYAVIFKSVEIFIFCSLFKGIIGGVLSILRFSWLKQFPDFQKSSRINLLANVLIQGSYCLVGLFLLISNTLQMAICVLLLDGLGSIFGAFIFWKMKKYYHKKINSDGKNYFKIIKSLVHTQSRKLLLSIDILICAGLGGTNIMIFSYGEKLFGKEAGYAIALIIYGLFYFLGGKIVELKSKGKPISLNTHVISMALLVIILSLIFLPNSSSTALKITLFSLIFFSFPLINLQVQSEWFKICHKNEAAGISSAEMIYSQVISAAFEIIYSILRYENIYRAVFLTTALFLIAFYSISRKTDEKEIIISTK